MQILSDGDDDVRHGVMVNSTSPRHKHTVGFEDTYVFAAAAAKVGT